MSENIDSLIHARWIVPVEPRGQVLTDHSIAIRHDKIAALGPTGEIRGRFTAPRTFSLPEHAVIPGLIIAADIGGHDVSNPSRSQRNDSYSPAGVSYSRLGVMADWYINPRRGFHVQSGIAFASLTLPDSTRNLRTFQTASYPDALSGVGGNIGVGWEGWVGADWSIGGLLRFDWASLRQSVDNGGVARASVTTPSLLFTMTFN